MSHDHQIALNFLPLISREFKFQVYRAPFSEHPDRPEGCRQRKLPFDSHSANEDYRSYWVSFEQKDGFESFTCQPGDNLYNTLAYLGHLLIEHSDRRLDKHEFRVEDSFYQRVSYVLHRYPEGEQRVWLQPYLLRKTGEFGFLVDFAFARDPDMPSNRKVQQLSLSLDKRGRENREFHVDKYQQLRKFLQDYKQRIFPLQISHENAIQIDETLRKLTAPRLSTKTYIFGNGNSSKSQFMGIKKHGPLQAVNDEVLLYFVYRPEDKPLSYDLYRALRGDTFSTFPGMDEMFGYSLGEEHVSGVAISEFEQNELSTVIREIRRLAGDQLVVPVILIPWDRYDADPREEFMYFWMKHQFLTHGIPTQFVSLNTLKDRNKFKWSVSNIGLGIFAKMGGLPWKVSPQHERSLIVGIGQSHHKENGELRRYFAYSVLTDSSGIYEDLEVLGSSVEEGDYLSQFRQNLTQILIDDAEKFDRFVIHSTFAIRKAELNIIREVLRGFSENADNKEVIALKFNDRNKYFGYAPKNNSMIPFESSYVQLSNSEYLIWFEGLQYHRPNVNRRIGGPMHIKFLYPEDELTDGQKLEYLQDALNLSGANWRGFNAKSSPVSIYYAYQIARYFRKFSHYDFEHIDLSKLTPWFL